MDTHLLLIAGALILSTLSGGLFALKFRDRLHLILSFSAGAVIGLAFFDLLPESLELAEGIYDAHMITAVMAGGFLLYMLLNQWFSLHAHHDEEHDDCENPHHRGGILGAGSLSLHSLLDGVAIGLAFQASPEVGTLVAAAVLAHDFSDGINMVTMVLRNGGSITRAFRWLLADAAAPALGIFSTMFFTVPQSSLALLLSVFTGFFLYIGASDLLPESHHKHPHAATGLMTLLGAGFMYAVIHFAHHA